MLREVLAEKPQSAKAHYELGVLLERQERYMEAQTELKQAKTLEPSLQFTKDPQDFERQLAHVNARVAQTTTPVRSVDSGMHPSAPMSHESSGVSPLTLVWIVIAGFVIVGLWLRRSASQPTVVEVPVRPPAQGFGQQYNPGGPAPYPPGYGGAYPPGYPPAGGSGIGSAVVGGVAGMAAGYALAKAMEGEHVSTVSNPGYVAQDAAPMPSSGVDNYANFEPSASDSWDNSSNVAGDAGDDSSW
jgi:hypothetical protein